MLLQIASSLSFSRRNRATFYQQPTKKFPPVFVRRFFLRYPHAHLYFVFGLCSMAMIGPMLQSTYLYMTMTPEEFLRYREEKNAVVKDRQRFGKNLWIPFYSSGERTPDATN